MDPRFDNDAQTTGTLPGIGAGALEPVGEASRPEPPAGWRRPGRPRGPGRYLAFEQDGRIVVVPVSREWTRIGRSLAADIRFDDATVSRRHALVANEEDGVRVLDDRSLNGISGQRPARRVEPADRRRRDRDRPPHAVLPGHRVRARSRRRPPAAADASRYRAAASMADTIAVLSLKGGTGKTTTVRTLADVLRRVGLDVLAVDLDPQGNLSDYFDVPPDAAPTVADVLVGRRQGQGRDPRRRSSPRRSNLAEVERSLCGQDGPRGRAQEGAQGRPQAATT